MNSALSCGYGPALVSTSSAMFCSPSCEYTNPMNVSLVALKYVESSSW